MKTLNQLNWERVKRINKELGIFQDQVILTDEKKSERQREYAELSKANAKYDYEYSVGSR